MSTTPEGQALDPLANFAFKKAVADGTAGDLLFRLYDGDCLSFDPTTRQLVFIPASAFDSLNTPTEQENAT